MSKKLHSGLKRTLAWMLVVALMVQGCMVVYADDFPANRRRSFQMKVLMKMPVQKVTWKLLKMKIHQQM